MGRVDIKPQKRVDMIIEEGKQTAKFPLYKVSTLRKFKPNLLRIGNIAHPSYQLEAIAAIFDLTGFTTFCKQVDPHLCMPDFLNKFLNWLYKKIRDDLVAQKHTGERLLYTELPFFSKFTGDGVLFLWNSKDLNVVTLCNIVTMLSRICGSYRREFYSKANKIFSHVPPVLRCGISRGMVCSIGNGNDFVGPCINIASRLQKLSGLTFCFSRRGIDFESGMTKETAALYTTKSILIRGIGEDEKVCVKIYEFDRLRKYERNLFKDV